MILMRYDQQWGFNGDVFTGDDTGILVYTGIDFDFWLKYPFDWWLQDMVFIFNIDDPQWSPIDMVLLWDPNSGDPGGDVLLNWVAFFSGKSPSSIG